MSDPACSSCPVAELEPAALISDGTSCRTRARFQRVLLVLVVLNLVATVLFGVLYLVEDDSSSTPSPTPTPTSAPPTTAAPDPAAEPTSEPGGSDGGTESGPTPAPTNGGNGGCGSIFDPECAGASGGIER
ncbi:hypothetical protein ACWEGS_28830 [Streptomyces sp. NPDC004822]